MQARTGNDLSPAGERFCMTIPAIKGTVYLRPESRRCGQKPTSPAAGNAIQQSNCPAIMLEETEEGMKMVKATAMWKIKRRIETGTMLTGLPYVTGSLSARAQGTPPNGVPANSTPVLRPHPQTSYNT